MTDANKDLIRSGFPINKTKYHDYQLPGGSNYQEMLLTLPDKRAAGPKTFDEFAKLNNLQDGAEARRLYSEFNANNKNVNDGGNYKSSHWDEPNILAHVRYNDRDIPDIGKSLHLEEIQSDWHQAGRKQGYKGQNKNARNLDEIQADLNKAYANLQSNPSAETKQIYDKIMEERRLALDDGTVPDAPFKKNWDELAFKRMLHKAANEGYDSISWTPGEAQAARYDLSKHYSSIGTIKNKDGTYSLEAFRDNGGVKDLGSKIPEDKLADYVGKDLAEKIKNSKEATNEFKGLDLKLGGEGMKSFYDKMLVDKANALAKKYGAKVETRNIAKENGKILKRPNGSGFYIAYPSGSSKTFNTIEEAKAALNDQPVHVLKLTPELRAKAKEGFPLFSSTPITTPVDYDPFSNDKKYKLVPIEGDPFK